VPEKPHAHLILDAFEPKNLEKDLVAIILWMIVAILCLYFPVLNQSFLRVVFAIPVILFIPGYVLTVALFPGREDMDGIERIALSFGLSLVIIPIIGLFLNYTPSGIRLNPIVTILTIFTAIIVLIAQYRRSLIESDKRFTVPFRKMLAGFKVNLLEANQSFMDRFLSFILIVAIIAAVITTIFVVVTPEEGEKFTEFYILGSGGKTAEYPLWFRLGEEQSLIIGIGNHEYRNVTYTVETILLNQSFNHTTNTSEISAYQPLDSFNATLAHNETREFSYNYTVNDLKFNRIQFLLFNETISPSNITGSERKNMSYRDLHLWIMVRPRGVP
jgi:uncharacterized membrane protein